ncbi:MAG: MAPEG family protein [Alphaproteobacteria bacterium]
MALSDKQRGVARGMAAAAAVTALVVAGLALWQATGLVADDTPGARIAFALRWDIAPLITLMAAIGALARHRFFTPADIDGSGLGAGSQRAHVLQAILQNTLEQLVLAVLAHLAWAVVAPVAWMAVVPAAAILFVAGRVLFWLGYARGAPARAFGFALTFYPTVAVIVAAAVVAVAGG